MSTDEPRTATQYRDASNLNARIALHERFSTNPRSLPLWIFDQLELPDDARVLEIGCGPGNLWADNAERIPDGWLRVGEKRGFFPPALRDRNGLRYYTEEDIERMRKGRGERSKRSVHG